MSAQQKKHSFDFKTQSGLGFNPQKYEIVVDCFCVGGGAGTGTGLEIGLGRTVSLAKNHSPQAISMITVNHPGAKHFTTDVFEGDPDTECVGKAVGWFHIPPDCTHHSQTAGGRVVKLVGDVAAPGEVVPEGQQFLIPDPKQRGKTWRRFLALLEGMGYVVEWRVIKACGRDRETNPMTPKFFGVAETA